MKRRDFFKGITVAVLIPSVAKATDHGDLEGLSDDDHTQYFEKWGIKYWNQEMVDNVNFLLEKLNHVLDHPYTEFDVREWSSKNLKAKCAFDVTQAMTKTLQYHGAEGTRPCACIEFTKRDAAIHIPLLC